MATLAKTYWKDGNGRKHRLFVVRSLGPNEGFGILNVYRNTFEYSGYQTREEAYAVLHSVESECASE